MNNQAFKYKFRAYEKETNEVVRVIQIQWDSVDDCINNVVLQNLNSYTIHPDFPKSDSDDDGIVLMQYTGFEDKNNKEIYEGDIIKYYNNLYQVKWATPGFCISRIHSNKFELELIANTEKKPEVIKESLEVVGNIYENPELLKTMSK